MMLWGGPLLVHLYMFRYFWLLVPLALATASWTFLERTLNKYCCLFLGEFWDKMRGAPLVFLPREMNLQLFHYINLACSSIYCHFIVRTCIRVSLCVIYVKILNASISNFLFQELIWFKNVTASIWIGY